MEKMNCWDVKKCGRGPDSGAEGATVCPAAKPGRFNGVNGGKYAGRFCWAVAGTFCFGNESQGSFAQKFRNCLNCNFLQQVDIEEGRFMILTPYEVESLSIDQIH